MKWANENGLTRVHSAGGDFPELDLYEELHRHGDMTVRFYISYFLDPPELRKQDLDAVLLSRPVIVSGSPAVATERRGV